LPAGSEGVSAATDRDGKYLLADVNLAELVAVYRDLELNLRAVSRGMVSQQVCLLRHNVPCVVPDLVVRRGASGIVNVWWRDGRPAKATPIELMLHGHSEAADDYFFRGTTNERGALRVGPVPDCPYDVLLTVLHPDAPLRKKAWERHVMRCDAPLECTIERGRCVSGRLLNKRQKPAAGYFVAADDLGTGVTRVDRTYAVGEDGFFEIRGTSADGGAVLVFPPGSAEGPGPALLCDPLAVIAVRAERMGDIVI
jgi:hypothetical protein